MQRFTAEVERGDVSCRLEKVAYAHRAVCSCGWASKFVSEADAAQRAWDDHTRKAH